MVSTRLSWDGGIGLDTDSSGGAFDPEVVTPPASVSAGERVIRAIVIDDVSMSGTQAVVEQRDASTVYQRHRVVVGGKDVTYFRGVQTPMPTYSLVSPLLYSTGQITFPQIHAAFERPGVGALSWLKKFAAVKVQRVDSDGVVVKTDYLGFISDYGHQGRTLTCSLGGEAEGRAAMQDRATPIFPRPQDIGDLVMPAIQHGLRLPVANRPTTGVLLSDSGGGSQLDFLTEVLALSTEHDGTQWTVAPNSSGEYRMFQKDTETITATVYIDGSRVQENLRRDFTEEPNRVWASGVDPDGQRIRFAVFPGLAPAVTSFFFSGPYSPGDSGDAVTEIMWRLFTVGYLDDAPFATDWTTDPDDPITSAVEDLQDDAGLSQTGVVNAATWAALFNPDVTGYSLRRAAIKPAAQKRFTQAFLRDATGNIIGQNPAYERSRPLVDATVDMGSGFTRRQIQKWAQRELADPDVSNWVGTITVTTGGVVDGEHNPGDALVEGDVRDARSIKPGANLWLPTWDGGTLVHVSGVNVSADSVEFAVDTRARDTMKVWEVIARNRESRKTPARQWLAQNRRSGLRDDTTAFYDGSVFGKIPRTFLPADTWTVVPTPAGRSGTIQTLDLQTNDDKALFGISIWGKKVETDWLDRKLGDPLGAPYPNRVKHNTKTWQDDRFLVNIWGQKDQPCGYWPDSLDPEAFNVVTQTGASVDASSDTFTLSHHGYNNGEQVYFSSGSVPAGLTADNDYFVIAATTNTFKVSATKGGSAMNITADKSGVSVSVHAADTPDVTGEFRDKASFPYFCQGSPVLWIAVRPDRDCWLQGGRVLELLLDDSAG